MDKGEAHVMSLLTIKGMGTKQDEAKEERKQRRGTMLGAAGTSILLT